MNRPALRYALATMLMLLVLSTPPGQAAELTLSDAEMANLGIQLAVPQATERAGGIVGRGRVTIPPVGDVTVSAPQPGLLVRLHVAAGDAVSAGQLLAEVRSPGFLAAQRDFLDAATAAALAHARLARDRSLVAEGIIARRRLEETDAAAQAAATALSEHRQMLRIAGLSEADIDALAADRQLRALLPVRSPIDGVVLETHARSGAGVTETDPLYRVADTTTLWLEIEVPQGSVDRLAPGLPVALEGSNGTLARVESVGRAVDASTQMVTVRALVVRDDHGLRPGQFLTTRIVLGNPAGPVWAVPASSVVRSGTGFFVFVRSEAGFIVQPVVRLGTEGDRAFVAGELDGHTRLAATGVSALKALWSASADEDV